ncbi:MAG: DegQ family serine endoprotease [Xanthomonadales bacterium]|nr:DegQ family serine endoprotease [Xanthomonadales bacterium]
MKQRTTVRLLALMVIFMSMPLAAKVSGLPDFTELVEKAAPAVVNIRVTQFGNSNPQSADRTGRQRGENHPEIPEFFRRYFDIPDGDGQTPRQPDRIGAGSGFIYSPDGYILTNHHVIEDADEIIVRMADRHEFVAKLIGSDEASDIAVLKIDADEPLPYLRMGESESLKAGQWVAAIGSPFNFEQSVTAGIVSAKGRSNRAQQYVPFIQSDVAINRGNSGGPLLNMDGEVVGINSWILSSSGGYIGLSFSIPVEVAASTAKQLRETGKVERGLLGVVVGAVTREMAEALDLERPVGALVNDVTEDGSADRAGIAPGDVILEFNGQEIETWNDLPPLVGANPPGTEATVLVSRNGKEKTFDVTLDALEGDDAEALAGSDHGSQRSNLLGLAVTTISAERRRELGDPEGGVVITDIESDEAWRAGLRPGDVILMINNRTVANMDDFTTLVEGIEPDRAVALRIWRNGTANFIAYTPRAQEEE